MKILVTPTSLQPGKKSEALNRLKSFTEDLVFNPYGRPLTEEELLPLLKDCDGYVAGLDFVTDKVLKNCSRLKVISRYGVGYDRVDIEAAAKYGIRVTNTPGVNAEAVGELTFGLLLSVARKIPYLDKSTREGDWIRSTGIELKNKTLGIMGLGAIGKVVARCAKGFGMQVITYDPYVNEEYCNEHHIKSLSIQELYKESDAISLHLPLNDETRHMIDGEAIEHMKEGVIIINASRGGIIDERAAYEGLKSGKIGGLGLDAFENEPPEDSRLFEFPSVVCSPHTGAHTKEATCLMADMAVDNLLKVLTGQECKYVVNESM